MLEWKWRLKYIFAKLQFKSYIILLFWSAFINVCYDNGNLDLYLQEKHRRGELRRRETSSTRCINIIVVRAWIMHQTHSFSHILYSMIIIRTGCLKTLKLFHCENRNSIVYYTNALYRYTHTKTRARKDLRFSAVGVISGRILFVGNA